MTSALALSISFLALSHVEHGWLGTSALILAVVWLVIALVEGLVAFVDPE